MRETLADRVHNEVPNWFIVSFGQMDERADLLHVTLSNTDGALATGISILGLHGALDKAIEHIREYDPADATQA